MAGSTPIESTELPDFHQIIPITLNGVVDSDVHLLYAERDLVLESAWIVCGVNDSDATLTLKKNSSGAIAAGTAVSSARTINSLAGTPLQFSLVATENIIPAGSWLGIDITGTSTAADCSVTLRVRTRIV